jgi:hypothetical protein
LTFNQGVPRSSRGWVTIKGSWPTSGRGGMADALDLGSSAYGMRVRVSPSAPDAVVAQLVERHLAKVEVASPSLVYRSTSSLAGVAQW